MAFLGTKASGKHLLISQPRYRAFLHRFETPQGAIIVPLDRIHKEWNFLEEVRFIRATTLHEHLGLVNYIQDTANVLYDAKHDFSKRLTRQYLLENTPLKQIPKPPSSNRGRGVGHPNFPVFKEYFPEYLAYGIGHKGKFWVIESPYKDEINFPKNIEWNVYYRQNDPRPRITTRIRGEE